MLQPTRTRRLQREQARPICLAGVLVFYLALTPALVGQASQDADKHRVAVRCARLRPELPARARERAERTCGQAAEQEKLTKTEQATALEQARGGDGTAASLCRSADCFDSARSSQLG